MLNKDYITGLVDGEGSFTAYVRNSNSSLNRRALVEPKFYVKLIERDQCILHDLKQYFGCGSIYQQNDKRPNHQNCVRYEVYNRKELNETIIPFFKQNKLKFVSKRNDFEIFCQIMELINDQKHLTTAGLKKIQSLKRQMH